MCISFTILLFYPEILKLKKKEKQKIKILPDNYISNPSIQPKNNESAKKMCYLRMLNLNISQIVTFLLEFSEAIWKVHFFK